MRLISSLLTVVFLLIFSLSSCSTEKDKTSTTETIVKNVEANYNYDLAEIETLDIINAYRKNIGLNSLEKINYISVKAEEHNNYMIAQNVPSHDNFQVRSLDIIETIGVKVVAENIAYDYSTANDVLKAWLNSPTHKANIEGNYTHFGISIRSNAQGKKFYTIIFVK